MGKDKKKICHLTAYCTIQNMYRAKIFFLIYFNVKSNGCLIFFSDRIANRILKLVDLNKSMGFL